MAGRECGRAREARLAWPQASPKRRLGERGRFYAARRDSLARLWAVQISAHS